MRSILLSAIFLLSLGACGSEEGNSPESETPKTIVSASGETLEIGPCCGGYCETPVGYCCSETFCGGNCTDTADAVWDHETNAPKLN